MTEAKKLRDLIVEEKRVTALLQGLDGKDPDKNYDAFADAVAQADKIELKNDIANKIRKQLAEVKERREIAGAWARYNVCAECCCNG